MPPLPATPSPRRSKATHSRPVRLLAGGAVLAIAGTYLAAQIDYFRRHVPHIGPDRYWLPQLTQVWMPGLAGALVLAGAAFALHFRRRTQ